MRATVSNFAQLPSPNLFELRLLVGLTRGDLASLADVAERTIYDAEVRGRVPRLKTQRKVVYALREALGDRSPTHPRRLTNTDIWPLADRVAA